MVVSASYWHMRKMWFLPVVLCLVLATELWAQFGGGGIPIPSIGHKKKKSDSNSSQATQQTLTADGVVVQNDSKGLLVATEDGRILTLKLNPQTKFTRKGATIDSKAVVPRSTVHVEASVDDEAFLTGLTVDVTKDAPAAVPGTPAPAPGQALSEVDESERVRPTILDNPVDAPDRPILRHGIPKKTTSADDDTPTPAAPPVPVKQASTAAPAPAKESTDFTITGDAPPPKTSANAGLIGKSKEWAESFMVGLPNFVCQQFTTRYIEVSRSAGWQPQDVITATVVYEDGHESYRDITVGGHKTSKSMLELGGATSTGEFASTLRSLFSDYSQTDFKLFQSTTIGQTPATIYDFKVALKHSDWNITVGGQALRPAYSGSIWIDRSSAAVRRIEMEAKNIPQDFPMDTVQWAIDYDNVRLGDRMFLLPVHAENLSCQRGSTFCSKNTVDFRNYRRYSGESTITFQ